MEAEGSRGVVDVAVSRFLVQDFQLAKAHSNRPPTATRLLVRLAGEGGEDGEDAFRRFVGSLEFDWVFRLLVDMVGRPCHARRPGLGQRVEGPCAQGPFSRVDGQTFSDYSKTSFHFRTNCPRHKLQESVYE